MRSLLFCVGLIITSLGANAQHYVSEGKMEINGTLVTFMVMDDGDTLYVADLDDVSVSSPARFEDDSEYRRYLIYRRWALKVYPYAKDAIRIFRETEVATQDLNNRKRKKHIKRLQKELKDEFEEPLKGLSKTQGKILVKMIEKELDTPMFDLLKGLRGGLTAAYWGTASRFFGYRLKDKYEPGDDKVLDAVLQDFDISYRVPDHKKTTDVTQPGVSDDPEEDLEDE